MNAPTNAPPLRASARTTRARLPVVSRRASCSGQPHGSSGRARWVPSHSSGDRARGPARAAGRRAPRVYVPAPRRSADPRESQKPLTCAARPIRRTREAIAVRPDVAANDEDGGMSDVLERFGPATQDWFRGAFAAPTIRAGRRVGCDLARQARARRRPDRVGQDAVGVPVGDRPGLPREGRELPLAAGTRQRRRDGCRGIPHPHPLHLAAQGARRRRRAQPALAARRHRAIRAAPRASRCPT